MKTISVVDRTGEFAEDKDIAATLREEIRETISSKITVSIDFSGVSLITQSFVHALISDMIRKSGDTFFDIIEFKGCNGLVRGIIETVVQYTMETMELDTS